MSNLKSVLSQCQLSGIGPQYTKVFSLIDINLVPLMAVPFKMRNKVGGKVTE